MIKISLLLIFIAFSLTIKTQTITDADGNIYDTVTIGTQVWLKENLKTTKYNDDTSIPNVTDNTSWGNLTTPAYCYYNNSVVYKATFGGLYNWYTVNTGKLCPTEWHVPTDLEWTQLTTYLGGADYAGEKMKFTSGWSSDGNGTNKSGFTAIPVGYRYPDGQFLMINFINNEALWWSFTEDSPNNAWLRHLGYYNSIVGRFYTSEKTGIPVRCLKDNNTSIISKKSADYINVYPNPASNKLYVSLGKSAKLTIVIYDLHGRRVLQKQIDSDFIDVSQLSDGLYIVKISNSGNIYAFKICINHAISSL